MMANAGLALVTPELPQDSAVQLISSLTLKSPPSFRFPSQQCPSLTEQWAGGTLSFPNLLSSHSCRGPQPLILFGTFL